MLLGPLNNWLSLYILFFHFTLYLSSQGEIYFFSEILVLYSQWIRKTNLVRIIFKLSRAVQTAFCNLFFLQTGVLEKFSHSQCACQPVHGRPRSRIWKFFLCSFYARYRLLQYGTKGCVNWFLMCRRKHRFSLCIITLESVVVIGKK